MSGNTGNNPVDETAPLAPVRLVASYPVIEQVVLNVPGMKGLAIYPGYVYDKHEGIDGMWLNAAYVEKGS